MRGDLGFYAGVLLCLGLVGFVNGLGSMSTIAASYSSNSSGSATVCGILSGSQQGIQCVQGRLNVTVFPNVSFLGISGGDGYFCGLRQGGLQLLCWNTNTGMSSIQSKRISKDIDLQEIVVGGKQVCGLVNSTGAVVCWRAESISPPGRFVSISAGSNFTCGLFSGNRTAHCWGVNGSEIVELRGRDAGMRTLAAGGGHVCGIRNDGVAACWGRNDFGQAAPPSSLAFEFTSLALGDRHTCAIRSVNKTVLCWGEMGTAYPTAESFETIVAGDNYTCGLTSANLSVLCWGGRGFESGTLLSLPGVLPGPCTQPPCTCGLYPGSQNFCAGSQRVCSPCSAVTPAVRPPAPSPAAPSPGITIVRRTVLRSWVLALFIVGVVGAAVGIGTVLWCAWHWLMGGRGRVHNSVQPTVSNLHSGSLRRQTSLAFRRQRSGTSSKRGDRAEEFTLADVVAATSGFSEANKIGAGSFGTVYRGKLADGREVAIKRGDVGVTKKFQEKEAAFQSELEFLSRLHHKHLVSLIGYCEEGEERMLVYEYMPNGALYDHLHKMLDSPLLQSWTTRIKVALDAARGVEYLHTYAVPAIIHRDIKSSNILLDATWTARVSDFGLSLMGPDVQEGHLSMAAAGTVGYMDPEYYRLQHLTTKSDVYGFGIVLLEILTGQRAIFKQETGPISVVDYAIPRILSDELNQILDSRVRPPLSHEIEAVELVAYTAVHCVSLEGKDRPSMTDVVANLERAVAICTQVSMSRNGSMVVTSRSDDSQ
uniref:non-specific serine/threonine protein kinase n=1 Tax=Araucaria cunninghamii TaxID=56994 RepID=A0A0D6QXM0_ARACU